LSRLRGFGRGETSLFANGRPGDFQKRRPGNANRRGKEALRRCELDISKIKCIIPHQANRRIIDAVGERLGAKPEQLFVNLDKYGNTSAASVAIALDEAVTSGRKSGGAIWFCSSYSVRGSDLGRGW
jgi:3-oxoacyl-[acyl-carrier-protein] synthase III